MKTLALLATVAALLGVGVVTQTGNASAGLRLATASTHSITKTVDEVGVVEPVSAAAVGFPVSGTVASVAVTAGQTVTRGQTLATLDTTELSRAVDTAQATLDEAKLTLADAVSSKAQSDEASSSSTSTTVNTAASTESSKKLAAAKQAVIADQSDVDAKLQAAQESLDSATQVCANATDGTTDSAEACRSALSDVLDAQRTTSDAETTLTNAINELDTLINEASASSSSAPAATQKSSTKTVSASDIAADQKAVDAATAALAVAKQDLAAATIVSPIDGTVQTVGLAAGDTVQAGSTSSAVKVVGAGGYEVTAIVAVDKLAQVKLGQKATVTPDGSKDAISGEVVAIGAPVTTNGSTTYPVSIALDSGDGLRDGTVATVEVVTAGSESTLAVPTTAVHVNGTRTTVNTVKGGKVSAVAVTIGVIGSEWTEIKSGLRAGQQVVLADLSTALPSAATNSSNGQTTNRDLPAFNGTGGVPSGARPGG